MNRRTSRPLQASDANLLRGYQLAICLVLFLCDFLYTFEFRFRLGRKDLLCLLDFRSELGVFVEGPRDGLLLLHKPVMDRDDVLSEVGDERDAVRLRRA